MENQNIKKHFKSQRKSTITFWSIVLVVALFFFLKTSGIIASVYFSAFLSWPIILFCISLICLYSKGWTAGIIFFSCAVFFWLPKFLRADPTLIPCLDPTGFVGKYWYLLLMLIAITIILQQILKKDNDNKDECWKKFESNTNETKDGFIKSKVAFSSNERIYLNEDFKGGKFETAFGSQEIDLRRCVIQPNQKAIIELSVAFGSCVIWVPTEWTVQVNTQSALSSLEDKRLQNPANSEDDMLTINGMCIFSSLEIRN